MSFPQTTLDGLVLGVTVGEIQKAYPLEMLARVTSLTDMINGTEVRMVFVPESGFAYAEQTGGERLPSLVTSRATWAAFYPHAEFHAALR